MREVSCTDLRSFGGNLSFLSCTCRILNLCFTVESLTTLCHGLLVKPIRSSMYFLYLDIPSFSKLGTFSVIISLNRPSDWFFSSTPSGTPKTHILGHWITSNKSQTLFSVFLISFSFCLSLSLSVRIGSRIWLFPKLCLLCHLAPRLLTIHQQVFC